ncbi:MAG TPA: 4-hydroxythreonine-4-phosphate dehydrogenase PdxA [Prosthecobacter sp.]|nr:4-hydroxythreonine-4-phosphate dehydrogenase PdxA [Prosthecobacter sp.]
MSLIAVTMGDPSGIGPEVCLHLLANQDIARECTPVIFGDAALLRRVAAETGLPFGAPVVGDLQDVTAPSVLDLKQIDAASVIPGRVDARCGEAAYHYVIAAIDAGIAGQVAAVTTGPLNKEALHAAGHHYPGHTEIFAERLGAEHSCMMQYSEKITCTFVTVHVGYHEVPALITTGRILEVIELTHAALVRIRDRAPKLLVCGLNPHAGEHGLFGQQEEERFIIPAIEQGRAKGIDLTGPAPPDTAFTPAALKKYDAVVCMYHDQGHIPVKMIAFDSAVNTTLGLRVPRTSVDHGTAFDIAWKGEANPGSMFAAVRLAAKLTS